MSGQVQQAVEETSMHTSTHSHIYTLAQPGCVQTKRVSFPLLSTPLSPLFTLLASPPSPPFLSSLTLLPLCHVTGLPQCLALHALPLNAQAREASELTMLQVVGEEVVHNGGGDDVTNILNITARQTLCVLRAGKGGGGGC